MTPVDYRTQTTLITGASAGLGVEFARQLAARGSNLVLVARRRDRLEKLAAELEAQYRITATVIPLDLSRPGAGATLAAQAPGVTSVVNNAGFGTWGAFQDESAERYGDEIALNVAALVDVTRAFIEPLQAYGKGVLINVASTAAYQPVPKMAVYAATKAFVLSFTEALWQESRPSGLRVLALSPGATETEFFEVVGTDAADGGSRRQTAEEVVTLALKTLDRRNPPPSVVSGLRNRLLSSSSRLVTRRRVAVLAGAMT
jgi:short-subunit dehydrogenase